MALSLAFLSALTNLIVLAGIPFLVYLAFHKLRHKRRFSEIAQRAGLVVGETRYLGYCAAAASLGVIVLLVWPPSLESSLREGSGFKSFEGLGFSLEAVLMALSYGVLKTGLAEEFLFRGLIAGSLSRRLGFAWANGIQALIFLAPHLFVLVVMPEMAGVLPLIFAGALFAGWARIRSGSILGPWLVHAAVNVTVAMSVAIRSGAAG